MKNPMENHSTIFLEYQGQNAKANFALIKLSVYVNLPLKLSTYFSFF